jgi:hypothetical protein
VLLRSTTRREGARTIANFELIATFMIWPRAPIDQSAQLDRFVMVAHNAF